MNRNKYRICAVSLIAAVSLSGCSLFAEKDPAMLTVDEETQYMKSEVAVLADQAVASVQSNYGEDWAELAVGDTSMTDLVKGAVLDQLMETLVFASMANMEGFTLNSTQSQQAQEQADAYLDAMETAADEDTTIAVTAAFKDAALAEAYEDSIRSLAGKDITDADAAVVRGKQLVINFTDESSRAAAEQTIADIQQQLNNGTKFNQIVSLYNEADQITVEFNRDEAVEAWQTAAFDMSAGDVSDRIELDSAYMLFQCITPMDEALTAEHLEEMTEEEQQTLLQSSYDKYLEEHDVIWNYNVWDDWDITEQ